VFQFSLKGLLTHALHGAGVLSARRLSGNPNRDFGSARHIVFNR
jgi:hypothetical protein